MFLGAHFGGNANNSSNAGFTYANSNNSPANTNANIGSHLYFFGNNINERAMTLPTWQKNSYNLFSVGRINPKTLWIKSKKKRMKRFGNLYSRIISIENLELADSRARKGKANSYGVRFHDKNREQNIIELNQTLLVGQYKTSKYDIFKIYEPKEREIYRLPYYPDRIVHHAIMNILEPIWESVFTSDTYSCIKGRGIHGAMKAAKKAVQDESVKYCLKIDIIKFYPSIDHDILKMIIRKKIKCKDTLSLLDEIIDSAKGVPIGNYVSQYFANLFLAYFDHWIKEDKGIKYYIRYADDMVFFSDNKPKLHKLLFDIDLYMDRLNLKVKDNYQIFPISKNSFDKSGRGIDFLGYVFYKDETRMRKSIKKNFKRTVYKMRNKNMSNKDYKQKICSWIGWAKHCNANNLIKQTLNNKL